MYAYRCKTCGALATPEAAGETAFPTACHHCGRGVRWDPDTGAKTILGADQWEVLQDVDPKELAAIGAAVSPPNTPAE
jgi:hypothetical protein